MNIAIDFGGTYDADPDLWNRFIADAIRHKHQVHVVTCRKNNVENWREIWAAIENRVADYLKA